MFDKLENRNQEIGNSAKLVKKKLIKPQTLK